MTSPRILQALAAVRRDPKDSAVAYDMTQEGDGFTVEQGVVLYARPPSPNDPKLWVVPQNLYGPHRDQKADYERRDDSARPLLIELVARDPRFGPGVAEEMRGWTCVSRERRGDLYWYVGRKTIWDAGGDGLPESAARLELKRRVLACLFVPCECVTKPAKAGGAGKFPCRLCSRSSLGRVELRVPCPECRGSGGDRPLNDTWAKVLYTKCRQCSGLGTIGVSGLIPREVANG